MFLWKVLHILLMIDPTDKTRFYSELSTTFRASELDIFWRDIQLYSTLQCVSLDNIISRLLAHEPYQYINGSCYFYDMDFYVTPATLIPRPETEELVYMIVETHRHEKPKIIDIGTGTGCIGLTLARHIPSADVTLLDVSPQALAVAKENAQRHQLTVNMVAADILQETVLGEKYDIIVSNPPYVPNEERKLMSKNVLDHEPELALFVDDTDPLKFYRKIAEIGQKSLPMGGFLYFECNEYNIQQVANMLLALQYNHVDIHLDMQGKKRMISCQWHGFLAKE